MKPPIAWYGGKTKLAPWVISHFPPHRIYVEPFGGSGAVLFAKRPAKIEVYNDLHLGVVNFYRVLRDPGKAKELQALLELTPYSRTEFNACRDELKESEPLDPSGCVRYAWAFAVCSYQSFGHQVSKVDFLTKPEFFGVTGPESGAHIPLNAQRAHVATLTQYAARLAPVEIECYSAETILKRHNAGQVLAYVDPPYVPNDCDSSYKYQVDQEALIDLLLSSSAMVVLSGMHNPLYDSRLDGWQCVELERVVTGANPKSTGGKRPRKVEVLWLNPACQAARLAEQPTLFGGAE